MGIRDDDPFFFRDTGTAVIRVAEPVIAFSTDTIPGIDSVGKDLPDGSVLLTENGIPARTAPEGTDVRALMDGYISVGQVRNMVLGEAI